MTKWLENYWYHYKWHTIITLFFVVVIIVCSVQMATKESYDAYITFIGNSSKVTQTDYYDILNAAEKLGEDYNEDGKVSICFNRETFIANPDDAFSSSINKNVTTFMQTYMYGDCFLFFIDPTLYEAYKESGMFVSLNSHVTNIPSEMIYDEMALKLSSTEFYMLPGVCNLPSDTLIVLKTVPYVNSSSKQKKMGVMQENHAKMLQSIIDKGVLYNE